MLKSAVTAALIDAPSLPDELRGSGPARRARPPRLGIGQVTDR
jgi:hypothetical protein